MIYQVKNNIIAMFWTERVPIETRLDCQNQSMQRKHTICSLKTTGPDKIRTVHVLTFVGPQSEARRVEGGKWVNLRPESKRVRLLAQGGQRNRTRFHLKAISCAVPPPPHPPTPDARLGEPRLSARLCALERCARKKNRSLVSVQLPQNNSFDRHDVKLSR